MASEEEKQLPQVNEIQANNGTRITYQATLSRGFRQFDLIIHMQKWEAPETIAQYLRIYADMLVRKDALVNNVDSLEN